MSAVTEKLDSVITARLAAFEKRLEGNAGDVGIVADIHKAIRGLLEQDGGNEIRIRRVLYDSYENGRLRKETFQLIKSILDDFGSEQEPTSEMVSGTRPLASAPLRASLAGLATNDPESG